MCVCVRAIAAVEFGFAFVVLVFSPKREGGMGLLSAISDNHNLQNEHPKSKQLSPLSSLMKGSAMYAKIKMLMREEEEE